MSGGWNINWISIDYYSATPVSDVGKIDYKMYPNPASDQVIIQSENASLVRIYNSAGSLMNEKPLVNNQADFDVSEYKSGIYFVEIIIENTRTAKKLVVQ